MNTHTKLDICKELPQVALEFMNTVHCEELALTQDLLLAIEANEEEKVSALMDEWVEHTVKHFSREERLMQEYRFPPYPIHKSEHVSALELLRSVQAYWSSTHDYNALQTYIKRDWKAWLTNHISTMDRVTASFLSQFDIQVDLDKE